MNPSENFNIISRIASVEFLEFEINEENSKKIDLKSVAFDHAVSIKFETESKSLKIETKTQLYQDQTKAVILGYITSRGQYDIINFDDMLSKFSGRIPKNLSSPFIGAQLATVRGFLIIKAKGTPLEGVVLPLVDTRIFFPQSDESHKE